MNRLARNVCLAGFAVGIILLGAFPAPSVATNTLPQGTGPVRGVAGDWWADAILGHPDFSEITPNEVSDDRVFNVGGVIVDRNVRPNRIYVFDGGNSRILGLSHLGLCQGGTSAGTACTANSDCQDAGICVIPEGVHADLVLGQPSLFGHSACNGDSAFQHYPARAPASAATLCNLPEDQLSTLEGGAFANMAVDGQSNLYVTDWWNHRVLRYDDPFGTDTVADHVWGQPDFAAKECNLGRGLAGPGASSLCLASPFNEGFTGGVAVDSDANLWIADNQNCRVLRFPANAQPGAPASVADLVLGQPDFTSSGCGSTLDHMFAPAAVRVDASGKVYVADSLNNRVLVFVPPLRSGMMATQLLGSDLRFPTGLEIDPAGGIWVVDNGNHQVLLFENGAVTRVLLKDVPRYDGKCRGPFVCDGTGPCVMCDSRASIGIDADGNIILADSDGTQDVWRFPAPIPEPSTGVAHSADAMLFAQRNPGTHNKLGPAGLYSPRGIAVSHNQVIVADGWRLLFWPWRPHVRSGLPAAGCAGEPDCFTLSGAPFGRIKVDRRNRLWVVRGPELQVYALPLKAGAAPARTINSPLPVKGGGMLTWTPFLNIGGIAVSDSGDQVWLTDPAGNRAFRITNALTDPRVDMVLGQPDQAGDQCNRGSSSPSASSLCAPGAVVLDHEGNVWVSDHSLEVEGNHRLLEWDAASIPAAPSAASFGIPATRVFGTNGSFTSKGCGHAGDPLCMPLEPAFDASGRMVVGLNGFSGARFPLVYDAPLTNPAAVHPINDFQSMPYAAAFDELGNLYLVDEDRHRVLIYWQSR